MRFTVFALISGDEIVNCVLHFGVHLQPAKRAPHGNVIMVKLIMMFAAHFQAPTPVRANFASAIAKLNCAAFAQK